MNILQIKMMMYCGWCFMSGVFVSFYMMGLLHPNAPNSLGWYAAFWLIVFVFASIKSIRLVG